MLSGEVPTRAGFISLLFLGGTGTTSEALLELLHAACWKRKGRCNRHHILPLEGSHLQVGVCVFDAPADVRVHAVLHSQAAVRHA